MHVQQIVELDCSRNSLDGIVRGCRLDVCIAFYDGGPSAALEALAHASLTLSGYVRGGELLHSAAFDPLQECAENLGLVEEFGQDRIQQALAVGSTFHAAMEIAA